MAKKKQSVQTPMGDLIYDVITILHEKAKGLEAFEKYIEDAAEDDELTEVLERIQENDSECVQELQQHLSRLLGQSVESGASETGMDEEEEEAPSRTKSRKSA
jgi:hypothetical protein